MNISISEFSIIFATLLGPILAVQAQKFIEYSRERRNKKAWVFHQLMATRAARVSPEHVQALNLIDLAFYGTTTLGVHHRRKSEKKVINAWKEYHDQLSTKDENISSEIWYAKSDELFINMLNEMGSDVGYKFDRVQLKKGAYSPLAHGEIERQQSKLREAAISLLAGETAINMNVTGFPIDENIQNSQIQLSELIIKAFSDEGPLTVKIERSEPEENSK